MNKEELYIGCKIIRAVECSKDNFNRRKGNPVDPNREDEPGYRVVYPDGYESWSPTRVFESAYRLVTESERKLF